MSTATATTNYKNLVVVGAASGIVTANILAAKLPSSHRLVLIEANEVAFWPIGALRAAVEPGFEKEIIAPLDLFKGTRHVVLAKTRVTALEPSAVIVDNAPNAQLGPTSSTTDHGGHRIEFDRIVLALGSSYSFPSRAVAPEEAKILQSFQQAQKDIERAQHLVVVGGGPVGVEFVGEVLERFPQKAENITLITRSDRLVSKDGKQEGVHHKFYSQLNAKGVKILFEDEIEFGPDVPFKTGPIEGGPRTFMTKNNGTSVQADYLLDGTGGKPNTSLISSVDPSILNDVGAIKVDAALRVKSSESSTFDWSRYLATGDCNDLPCAKTWFAAEGQAKTAANNILEIIKTSSCAMGPVRVQDASLPPNMIVVPLGKKGGASQLFVVSLGGWFTSFAKGKSLFISQFKANYR